MPINALMIDIDTILTQNMKRTPVKYCGYRSGPSCSKLTISLVTYQVNETLYFQNAMYKNNALFWLKQCGKNTVIITYLLMHLHVFGYMMKFFIPKQSQNMDPLI